MTYPETSSTPGPDGKISWLDYSRDYTPATMASTPEYQQGTAQMAPDPLD